MATAAKGISDKLDTNTEESNKANEEVSNGKENKVLRRKNNSLDQNINVKNF